MNKRDLSGAREVLEKYINATYSADVDSLRRLFHPAALMTGYLAGGLVVGDPEPFFADLERHPAMAESGAPYEARIEDIHVGGRIASARLRESGFFGEASFLNYFHLLEVEGDWKILSKTFESA